MRLEIMAALMTGCLATWADELPENISDIKTLTVKQAEALLQHEGMLWLTGLTSLDADSAKVLAHYNGGSLYLNGLTTMDTATAEALAGFKGAVLCLAGLKRLEPDTAKAIVEFRGTHLLLDGLTTLDADTAKALAGSTAWTGRLPRVTTLDVDTAKSLVEFKGRLPNASDGSIMPDADAAKANAQFKYVLWLDGLTSLSHEAAAVLRSNPQIKLPEKFQRCSQAGHVGPSRAHAAVAMAGPRRCEAVPRRSREVRACPGRSFRRGWQNVLRPRTLPPTGNRSQCWEFLARHRPPTGVW